MSNRKKVIDFLLENAGRFVPPLDEHQTSTAPKERDLLVFQTVSVGLHEVISTKTVSGGTPTARQTLRVPYLTYAPDFSTKLNPAPNVQASGTSVVIGSAPPLADMNIWGVAYWKERFNDGGNVRLVPAPIKFTFGTISGAWMPDSSGQRALAVPNYISVAMYTMSPRTPVDDERIAAYSFGIDTKELAEAVWGSLKDDTTKLPGLGTVIRNMANKAWEEVIKAMMAAGMPNSAVEEANIRLRRVGFDVDKIVDLAYAYFMLQLAGNVKANPQRFYVTGTNMSDYAAKATTVKAAVQELSKTAFEAVSKAVETTMAFAKGLVSVSVEMALSVLGTGKFSKGVEGNNVDLSFTISTPGLATIARGDKTTTITIKEGIWQQEVSEGGWLKATVGGTTYVLPWTEHAWDALATQLSNMANDLLNPLDLTRDFSQSFFVSELRQDIKRVGLEGVITIPEWSPGTGLLDYTRSIAAAIESSKATEKDKERLRQILAKWTSFVGGVFTSMGITNVKELERAVSETLSGLKTNPAWAPVILVQPNLLALATTLASKLKTTIGFPPTEPTFEPWPGPGISPEPTFGPQEQPL